MKKFSILLCLGAAVLSLASCTREQLVPDGLYTITASREGDAATKTYVDDGPSLVWAADDKIGVFNGQNKNIGYSLSAGEGTGSAEFSGETAFAEGKLYAYYPYSGNTTSGSIVVDLSKQTYSKPSDFGKYFYMVGSADVTEGATDINIKFKNPLAAFVFTVDNNLDHAITVTGFSVSTLDLEPVFHQKATLNLTAEDPTVLTTTNDDLTNEISVTIDDIEVAAREKVAFPLVVLPANLSDKELDFTFSYTSNGDSKTVTKSVSGKEISRNTFITGTFALEGSTIGGDIEGSWDGTSVSEPETDGSDANVYYIKSAAELAWVAQQVNEGNETFEGKTLRLMNDINLNEREWTPIGKVTSYPTKSFHGTFDGQGYTISNLKASDDLPSYAAAGLFGSICGTVKNLTLKDVDIRSTHYAGAVAAYSSANGSVIENCHVDGGTITTVPETSGASYDNGDKAGGIIGYYVVGDKVENCTAKNLTITAYRDLGGITGCGPQSGMTGCSVENITLVQDNTNGYKTEAITTVGALGGRDIQKDNQPYDGDYASAVTKKVVGNVYVSTADQLASALTSSASEISVTFANNIEVSGDITLPSNVSLNLNGKTLTAKRIQAANDNSVIAITNGTVEFSGTGNGVELFAGNSTLTLDGVTLNASKLSGMAVCCGSIKRPEWAGNTIVIRNSTINAEQNDAVGIQLENAHNLTIENSTINHDYFGINQNGTNPGSTITLKDCDISGTYSGIYLSNYAGGTKNTLKVEGGKIHSEEESAIEVKKTDISVIGATLSSDASKQTYSVNDSGSSSTGYGIVLAGYAVGTAYEGETSFTNNIFNLAAGENAVGILRYDGKNGAAVISSDDELAAALSAGNSTIYLTKGEYVIPAAAKGKTVTFVGTGNPEDVEVNVTPVGGENCDYGLDGSNATFEGITITTNSSNYVGYARCDGTYKNCIINGTYTLYGKSTFENCEFNVSGNVYNIWTWGADEIEFTGCTFNSDGKALLLYREYGGIVNLTVKDCTFNDTEELDFQKAAIEIGDSPYEKPTYNVTVSNTQVNGYAINGEGENTGSPLWGNKNSMPKDRLSVTVDGNVVY